MERCIEDDTSEEMILSKRENTHRFDAKQLLRTGGVENVAPADPYKTMCSPFVDYREERNRSWRPGAIMDSLIELGISSEAEGAATALTHCWSSRVPHSPPPS